MNFVDVHAHLELFGSNDISAVVARAAEKGVKAIITNSVDAASSRKSLQLQKEFGIVKAALGIYPLYAAKMGEEELDEELKFMENSSDNFVAFGEIGLDYEEMEDRKIQQAAFEKQLALARKLRKPVIVHSRKAEKEVVETLMSGDSRNVVLHAFHGSMKLVKKAADSGFCFSIPSNIARSSHFRKIAEILPIGNILTETDAPYLGPGKDGRSEPAYVAATVEKIAEIKGKTAEETAASIYGNYEGIFGRQ